MSSTLSLQQMVTQLMVIRFPGQSDAIMDLLDTCSPAQLEELLAIIAAAPTGQSVRRKLLSLLAA